MKEYNAIYVGNGKIEAFGETTEGQELFVFIPNELKEDYIKNEKNLLIRTVRYHT